MSKSSCNEKNVYENAEFSKSISKYRMSVGVQAWAKLVEITQGWI